MSKSSTRSSTNPGASKAISDLMIALRKYAGNSGNPRTVGFVGIAQQNKDWWTVRGLTSVNGDMGDVEVKSVATIPVTNNSSLPTESTFTRSVTTKSETTVSFTAKQSVGVTVESDFHIPFIGGASVTVEVSLDFEESVSHTTSVEKTWEIKHSVTVPAHTSLKFRIIEKEGRFDGEWIYTYEAGLTAAGVAGLQSLMHAPDAKTLQDFFPGFQPPPAVVVTGPLVCTAALEVDVIDEDGESLSTGTRLVRPVLPPLPRSKTAHLQRKAR